MFKSMFQSFTFFRNGEDGTVYSNTAPEDSTKLWMDTSVIPPLLKYYADDGEWTIVNKSELDAIDTRVKSAELNISNLDATIESRCEDVVETKVGDRVVGLEQKTSNIQQTPTEWTASFKYTGANGKEETNSIRLSMNGVDVGDEQSYSRMSKSKFSIILEGQEVTSMSKIGLETDEVYARKRMRVGNVMMIATDYGIQERWVGD